MESQTYPGYILACYYVWTVTADPGFPRGGAHLVRGADSQDGYVSKTLYVNVKESGPLGGGRRRRPGSANACCTVEVTMPPILMRFPIKFYGTKLIICLHD